MPTKTIGGVTIDVTDDGFFTQPATWTEAMVPQLAADEGIAELTEDHWQIIKFMRAEYLEHGSGPPVRMLSKASGVGIKELYRLFPKGPAKVAAKLAGIPKPRGCI